VQARYRYAWAGRSYESTRVGLPGGMDSDNIDGWHQGWRCPSERRTRRRAAGSRLGRPQAPRERLA